MDAGIGRLMSLTLSLNEASKRVASCLGAAASDPDRGVGGEVCGDGRSQPKHNVQAKHKEDGPCGCVIDQLHPGGQVVGRGNYGRAPARL